MFEKKKLNFWRLAVIFLGFTGITLAALWLAPQEPKATMMNESMANMASMHLNNTTIYDLTGSSDSQMSSANSGSTSHTDTSSSIQLSLGEYSGVMTTGIITTIIIFALIPLLICGVIILSIVWIK